MTTILLKLKYGNEELDLTDWEIFYPLRGGIQEEGQRVTCQLYVKAGSVSRLSSYIHQLRRLAQLARDYALAARGQPVYLGYKLFDGLPYDTYFGPGWLWRALEEDENPAISIDVAETWNEQLAQGLLQQLTLTFNTRPVIGYDGQPEYAWCPLAARPILLHRYAIQRLPNGGIYIPQWYNNLFGNFSFEQLGGNNLPLSWSLSGSVVVQSDCVFHGQYGLYCTGDSRIYQTLSESAAKRVIAFRVRKYLGGNITSSDCEIYWGNNTGFNITGPDSDGWYTVYAQTDSALDGDVGFHCKGARLYVDFAELIPERLLPYIERVQPRRIESDLYAPHASDIFPTTGGTVLIAYTSCRDEPRIWGFAGNDSEYTDGNLTFRLGGLSTSVSVGNFYDKLLYLIYQYSGNGIALWVLDENGEIIGHSAQTGSCYIPLSDFKAELSFGAGYFHQIQSYKQLLTESEIVERVRHGVGRAELPCAGLISDSAAGYPEREPYLYNFTELKETGRLYPFIEIENMPGDTEAGLLLLARHTMSDPVRHVYISQLRRNMPRPDLPATRFIGGSVYQPGFEAEANESSYDSDTETIADTNCSSDAFARTTASSYDEKRRLVIPLCSDPIDLWKIAGRWRIMARVRTAAENIYARFALVVGKQQTMTNRVMLHAVNDWVLLDPTDLVIDIPNVAIEPETLQAIRGAYDTTPYCYLEYYLQFNDLGAKADIDCVILTPTEFEGWAQVNWEAYHGLVLDTCGYSFNWRVVFGDEDHYVTELSPIVRGFDWSGQRFTVPIGQPIALIMLCFGDNFKWPIISNERPVCISLVLRCEPRYYGML